MPHNSSSQIATGLLACIFAVGWYVWQGADFWFFKDDFVNLFFAYELGWQSLLAAVFERGLAPGYRWQWLIITSADGPNFTRALLICAIWYGLSALLITQLITRLLGGRGVGPTATIAAALTVLAYPLVFGSSEWLSSAFHLLPALFACLLLALLLDPSAATSRRRYGLALATCLTAGLFAGPESLLLMAAFATAAVLAPTLHTATSQNIRLAAVTLGILMLALVTVSELANWERSATAQFGAGAEDYWLQLAVFLKSLGRYSAISLLSGNVMYLQSGLGWSLLGLVLLLATTVWALRFSPHAAGVAIMAWAYSVLNFLLITQFRSNYFGWIIIPEHRYWLLPSILFWLLAVALLLRQLRGPRTVLIVLLAILSLSLYQGQTYKQTLFPKHDFKAAEKAVAEARQIADGELPERRCRQRLPAGVDMPAKKYDHKWLLVRYFSDERCDFALVAAKKP